MMINLNKLWLLKKTIPDWWLGGRLAGNKVIIRLTQ